MLTLGFVGDEILSSKSYKSSPLILLIGMLARSVLIVSISNVRRAKK